MASRGVGGGSAIRLPRPPGQTATNAIHFSTAGNDRRAPVQNTHAQE